MSDESPAATGPARRPRPPIGAIGRAFIEVQAPAQTATLVASTLGGIALAAVLLPLLAEPLGDRFGVGGAIWLLALLGWLIFVAAVAVLAFVPPLLLSRRDRAVFAAHSWIGARETRRAFGRASRAIGLPTDGPSVDAWLARTPSSDRNRFVRVDALLIAGRFDDARAEAALMPERTPLESYRKREEFALIVDQEGIGDVDEDALRAAIVAIPPGIDRTEATLSFAAFRARRAVADGDWRAPLLEARPEIPGSDVGILLADFGLPIFEILWRRIVLPFTVLLGLIAAAVTVLPA